MLTKVRGLFGAAVVVLLFCGAVAADEIVLSAPGESPRTYASALDQPELDAVLFESGSVITDAGEPVIFEAFIDTGASGFVISHLQATGEEGVPSLGLGASDFVGEYTETGVGGSEVGDTTTAFGVRVLNGEPGMGNSGNIAQFVDYGSQSLWVRRSAGPGEVVPLPLIGPLVDPLNVVGMPAIRQQVMVMDPTPLSSLGRMQTHLLPVGDAGIPQTNITFDLYLKDFTGLTPPGEVAPSLSENPVVRNVTISHTAGGPTNTVAGNEWLFDTGSGSTFISFDKAQDVGLIAGTYASLADFMAGYSGTTTIVGGIGPALVVPILELDEIRIPAKEGFDVVWRNVDVLVLDVEGPDGVLDGVFGTNLLLPAMTVDFSLLGITDPDDLGDISDLLVDLSDVIGTLFAMLGDISPGHFDDIVFDATDANNVELRLYSSQVPEPSCIVMLTAACILLVGRRPRRRAK